MDNERDLPRVAILLAAYNGAVWINEQLDSILSQKSVSPTIFVSVDLSEDETKELIEQRAKNDSRIVVLRHIGRIGSAAKNFFRLIKDVDFESFDYVALSDQDDIWLDEKLSRAISLIKEGSLDAVSSDVKAFWNDGKVRLVKKSYPQKLYDHFFEAAGPGCTYVIKSSSFSRFRMFILNHWEKVNKIALHDWLIYAFFREAGMCWYIDDSPLLMYRQHSSNVVGFNSGLRAYFRRISLVKAKWYRSEVENIMMLLSKEFTISFPYSRWYLIRHFFQLRRRPRDAVVFLFLTLSGMY